MFTYFAGWKDYNSQTITLGENDGEYANKKRNSGTSLVEIDFLVESKMNTPV